MTLRPAPGQQIAAGRLRVDAAKAIAKLREYQLVDRTAWVLEAIRAAVASGATSIDLQGDSNDVWLTWSGTPWPAEDLPRLFDELVSPEPTGERHHLRLLAAAVNSALGANPAYIDIYAITETGAVRARYTPDVLDAPTDELAESPLRKIHVERAAIDAPVGMHVHYRRRASLEVVAHWLRNSEPPELAMARSACGEIATPIRIGLTNFDRARHHTDIARVPLGNDLAGFLAIADTTVVRPAERAVVMAVAERGVLLETTTVDLGFDNFHAPTPLRLVVDGDRMPTNASRSEVRRDAHPIAPAVRRARELLPELVEELAKKLSGVEVDPRARHAALHLLATVVPPIGGGGGVHEVPEIFRALAEKPLVCDATGIPRPVAWSWNGLLHLGREPFAPEFARWLSQVLWVPPGDPARVLAKCWPGQDSRLARYMRTVRKERRAEKKFYKHEPREARVVSRRKPRIRARLGAPIAGSCIPDATFEGLTGEICVFADRTGGELTVLLGGRQIETVSFDSAIGFAATVDSARLRPTDRFRGVARDVEYERVEAAMRGGVVRAIEALALAGADTFADGYHVAVAATPYDRALIRQAMFLTRNLGVPLSPALVAAPIWMTAHGLASLDELRQHAVLGVVPAAAALHPLVGRVIVSCTDAERRLLDAEVASTIVEYEPFRLAEDVGPSQLSEQVIGDCTHAFTLREDGLVAAIVPAAVPKIVVSHRGVRLAELDFVPRLAPCRIAIDCDAVVPTPGWNGLADDAGLAKRDYEAWERAFVREIAKAITGERSPDFYGGGHVDFTGPIGRYFCASIVPHADVKGLLGEGIYTQLRMCSLVRVLGDNRLYSIEELAVMFSDAIAFVEHPAEPVEGFPVVLAELAMARAIAKLAVRKHRNVTLELAERRAKLARELRFGMHRAKARHEMAVPYGGVSVKLASTVGQGVVGVGREVLEINVLVENRLFQTITMTGVPVVAVIELDDAGRTDDKFEAVRTDVVEQLVDAVLAKTPEVLLAIAQADPAALAAPGARRSLLAAWIAKGGLSLDLRDTLARTVVFPTVHGPPSTVAGARRGPKIPATAWHGEWLAADGDQDPALDRAILALDGDEVGVILAALGTVLDVTADVEKLQAQRRIARGLLPTPMVPAAVPAVTRRLADLGFDFRHLGHGEVSLVGGPAEVLIHVHGELVERALIECVPPVQLAIEAPELVGAVGVVGGSVGADARKLAIALAHVVLAEQAIDTLAPEIRRGIRLAILMDRIDRRDVAVFETATGTWIDLAAVQTQRELFGNLWAIASPDGDTEPLDERRIVLVLAASEIELATKRGIPVVDARSELQLDARTRKNRARPPSTALAFGGAVLAQVELDGDGVTAPRGIVGVLAPSEVHRRGFRLHRAMHPFDEMPDLCRWPTIAVIDDARLTPDRCWDVPVRDEVYKDIVDRIHKASNEAIRNVVQPPAGVLAQLRVAPWTYDTVAQLRTGETQLRGTMWLAGPPLPALTPEVRVIEGIGERAFVPLRGTGLTGTVYVHAPRPWKAEEALEELCAAVYAKLVRELAYAGSRRDPDIVGAHVAWALALDRLTPAEAKHVHFSCFRPEPLDAFALHKLLRASEPVVIVRPESKFSELALVDDGTETSRVIKAYLGMRLRSPAPRKRPDTVEPPPPIITTTIVQHPLQPFLDVLHARIGALGIAVRAWRIVDDRKDPIVAYSGDGVLELAGDHRHVIDTAAAVAAKTAWSGDALDSLAAHCVTVLNVALTEITDAAEAVAISRLVG